MRRYIKRIGAVRKHYVTLLCSFRPCIVWGKVESYLSFSNIIIAVGWTLPRGPALSFLYQKESMQHSHGYENVGLSVLLNVNRCLLWACKVSLDP